MVITIAYPPIRNELSNARPGRRLHYAVGHPWNGPEQLEYPKRRNASLHRREHTLLVDVRRMVELVNTIIHGSALACDLIPNNCGELRRCHCISNHHNFTLT